MQTVLPSSGYQMFYNFISSFLLVKMDFPSSGNYFLQNNLFVAAGNAFSETICLQKNFTVKVLKFELKN